MTSQKDLYLPGLLPLLKIDLVTTPTPWGTHLSLVLGRLSQTHPSLSTLFTQSKTLRNLWFKSWRATFVTLDRVLLFEKRGQDTDTK